MNGGGGGSGGCGGSGGESTTGVMMPGLAGPEAGLSRGRRTGVSSDDANSDIADYCAVLWQRGRRLFRLDPGVLFSIQPGTLGGGGGERRRFVRK